MRALLKPGMFLLNRFSYTGKFLLGGALLGIVLMFGLVLVLPPLNQEIRLVKYELFGLDANRGLIRLLDSVQQHRGLSGIYLSGDTDLSGKLGALQQEIQEHITEVDGLVQPLRNAHFGGKLDSLKQEWQAVLEGMSRTTPERNFDAHTQLIGNLREMMSLISDQAGLTRASCPATYYLAKAIAYDLPLVLESMAGVRGLGSAIISRQRVTPDERAELISRLGVGKFAQEAVDQDIRRALQYGDTRMHNALEPLEKVRAASMDGLIYLTGELILSPATITFEPTAFFAAATKTINSNYRLYDATASALRHALEVHLEKQIRHRNLIYMVMIATMMAFAYLALAIYYSLHSSIQAIRTASERLVQGDLDARIRLESSDEMAQIADSFNVTADKLQSLICRVTTSEQSLVKARDDLEVRVEERTRDLVKAKEEAEEAKLLLDQLNDSLEQIVSTEVAQNMEHERMLIQQSRHAVMGEMIGNIAHQWRQPLNALALLLNNIKDAYEYNELDADSLDKSISNGNRLIHKMSSTIDDFRNFFKPNKKKQPFSMRQAVADTLNLVGASFRNANITVQMEGEGDLHASGFPNEFSQVLLNLLNNARDAMQERKLSKGKVVISLTRKGEHVSLTVRDSAGGIPEEVLSRIFDPYFTTKENGTGIGLYMSKMIMEHLDGNIEASNVDGGAEFTLTLPVAGALGETAGNAT